VIWQVPAYYGAQSLLFLLHPFLILIALSIVPWRAAVVGTLWRPIWMFAGINALVVLGQRARMAAGGDFSADLLVGCFNDAHSQAVFSFTLVLLLLSSAGWSAGRRAVVMRYGLAVLCLLSGLASQDQKATGILAVLLAGAAVVRVARSRITETRVALALMGILAGALVIGVFASASRAAHFMSSVVTGNLEERVREGRYEGLNFVADLGLVEMAADYTRLAGQLPAALFLGFGPGNFGSPAALTRFARGEGPGEIRRLFWRESTDDAELAALGELRLLGLSARASLPGIVLGECGIPALLVFLMLLCLPLLIRVRSGRSCAKRDSLFWLKCAYLAIVMQSALNTLGAWDNGPATTAIMCGFAGYLARSSPARPDTAPVR